MLKVFLDHFLVVSFPFNQKWLPRFRHGFLTDNRVVVVLFQIFIRPSHHHYYVNVWYTVVCRIVTFIERAKIWKKIMVPNPLRLYMHSAF